MYRSPFSLSKAGEWVYPTPAPEPQLIVSPDPENLPPNEETEWISAAQRGDRAAFAKLVDRYWDRLFRWLVNLARDRHKAEDLAQETFLKALAALETFRLGSNFRAWLFRIGHNNFVNLKRTERRTKVALPEDAMAPDQGGPGGGAADREALTSVAEALAGLSEEFRSALVLHVQEGLAYKEVAKVLNTTEETARWRVFKARQKLLKVLPEDILKEG